ncbi:MAG TPA: hypothetical protein VKE74_23245 [Gemmataceae bacterium]|nr:hypothetical protein [Gemmataceae bacterium]
MPVRFRCPHCNRLLGIARRKAGTQINCPQCGLALTVPVQDDGLNLDEIDVLLHPEGATNGMSPANPAPRPEPPQSVPQPEPQAVSGTTHPTPPRPVPVPQSAVHPAEPKAQGRPAPKPPEPKPQPTRKSAPNRDAPLLERDVDSLLGIGKAGTKFELDEEPARKARPVSGMDSMSLGSEPRGLVLSPQKATLLVVAVVVLLGIAFAAGFLIASNI